MDNLKEMDKFLDTYNLPGLNHEELENLHRLITMKLVLADFDYKNSYHGGGTGTGNTCKSMADSCQCMAKTTTIL